MLYEKDLDAVLHEIIARWGIPGMAVGVVENDEIVYANGFGVQSLETQSPVTMDSVFSNLFHIQVFRCNSRTPTSQKRKNRTQCPIIHTCPIFAWMMNVTPKSRSSRCSAIHPEYPI